MELYWPDEMAAYVCVRVYLCVCASQGHLAGRCERKIAAVLYNPVHTPQRRPGPVCVAAARG